MKKQMLLLMMIITLFTGVVTINQNEEDIPIIFKASTESKPITAVIDDCYFQKPL